MTDPWRILIVEDDRGMRQSLVDLIEAAGWTACAIARAAQAADRLAEFDADVILSDVRMPGMSGLDLLASLKSQDAPPIVLISAHGDIPMAVEAIQGGAYSFVEKPYEPRRLLSILAHASEQHRMREVNGRLRARLLALSGLDRVLLGDSDGIVALRTDILDLADSPAPVLIRGETGTGKELVARALHDLGTRGEGPFVALNCANITAERFEDEMFGGHGQSEGRLGASSGGTLFLDEICTSSPEVQAKLLRVIEDGEVLPTGSAKPVPVDLRIVAATNDDIDQAVAEGRLRADLLFRINTVTLSLPPLRDRRDDIGLLMSHFLGHIAETYETRPPELGPEDMAALLAHDWPGNVRELRNVAERRVLAARRGAGSMASAIAPDQEPSDVPPTLREAVAAFEREMIGKAIQANEGRMDAVAEALGIGRRTLNEKIVKLGLDKAALL